MKINRVFYTCVFAVAVVMSIHAQRGEEPPSEVSLAQRLGLVEKREDKFNMYMDFRTHWNSFVSKSNYQGSYFAVDQLSLEMNGQVNDRISYQFKQHLNKSTEPGSDAVDKLSGATDFALVSYRVNNKLSFIVGKQVMAVGGVEFDYSPLHIYQSADIFQNMSVSYAGVNLVYEPVEKHKIQLQLVNNSADKLLAVYDYEKKDSLGEVKNVPFTKEDFEEQGIERVKTPLGYSLNWNGNLWRGKMRTYWSYSIFQESKKDYWKFLAIGSQFNFRSVIVDVDYFCSDENIDRERYGTEVFRKLTTDNKRIATNVVYNTYILKVRYNFVPRWNVFVKGAYETAYSKDMPKFNEKTFRKSYGYVSGLEYMPIRESDDMRVYLVYKSRKVDYPQPVANLGSNFHCVYLGLSYRLKML